MGGCKTRQGEGCNIYAEDDQEAAAVVIWETMKQRQRSVDELTGVHWGHTQPDVGSMINKSTENSKNHESPGKNPNRLGRSET